jgi:hypothetical protein
VCPSLEYQAGDVGLLDECEAVVRSVDQVTLLPPDAELDSATAATPALSLVETVSDDDSVLAGDATCTISTDIASVTNAALSFEISVLSRATSPMNPQIRTLTSRRRVRVRY